MIPTLVSHYKRGVMERDQQCETWNMPKFVKYKTSLNFHTPAAPFWANEALGPQTSLF